MSQAVKILKHAHDIVENRSVKHGEIEPSFKMVADMWTTYIQHLMANDDGFTILTPRDVCFMLTQLKQVRAVFGIRNNQENFIDGAGYMALAGELSGVTVEEENDIEETVRGDGDSYTC